MKMGIKFSRYSVVVTPEAGSRSSLFSFSSTTSMQSSSRLWCRVSRRRWKQSTLNNPYQAAKTAWPVTLREAFFLPEFPVMLRMDRDNFDVVEIVARGVFGNVYKVIDKTTKEEFALKALSKVKVIQENAVTQCKDEATIHSMCGHHPYIVTCRNHWQKEQHLFILTEWEGNGELMDLWQHHGALPESLVRIYVAELALVLDFLHGAGVMYRDLKLENILLDSKGNLKLIDFGLAKWVPYGQRTFTICGTMQYMAPEVLRMEPYTHRVDWWCLGIVMYALLTGTYPLEGQPDHSCMLKSVEACSYDLPPAYQYGEAAKLLDRLLHKDPKFRLSQIRQIQKEGFFMNFDFDALKEGKISPKELLEEYKKKQMKTGADSSFFSDFDSFNRLEE